MNKILIINAGSSSIKWTLFNNNLQVEAKGLAERIKMKVGRLILNYKDCNKEIDIALPSFLETIRQLVKIWKENKIINNFDDISKVAFRIVNGGPNLQNSTYVNNQTIDWLKESIDLAPVHNPGALEAIEAFRKLLPNTSMTMHFDTSFHNTLPKVSYTYPINNKLSKELNIRKYGFHGLNYHYITEKCKEIFNKDKINAVIMHIGNGASLCAIEDSKSIDTSMGFTPLAGIMMGTRSGDFDPSIIPYIVKHKNLSLNEIFKLLNEKSGMLGISEVSSDIRDIQKVKSTNPQALFALDLYTQRIADYLITYINKINNKLDAIIFTAGVGENDHLIRKQVIEKIKLINLKIDDSKNENHLFKDYKLISSNISSIPVYVIRAEEEMFIAKEAISM